MEKFISSHSENNKIEILETSGYWLNTNKGKLLDFQMGNSAFVFGYNDHDILNRIQNNKIKFVKNGEGETSQEIRKVVSQLLELSNMSALSWTVSGTDAVETALAISDHYWQNKNPNKNKILSLVPCYHGASWLTRSLRGEIKNDRCEFVTAPQWIAEEDREGSENSTLLQAEEKFKSQAIGTIIIESIPWVLGVYPFSETFWSKLKVLCDKYDVLIVLDDVAGCFGKVGKPFSNTTLGIEADIIAVGKSLSGGYAPIGAALLNRRVFDCIGDVEWNHTYTYNPNTLGVSAISAVLDKVPTGIFDNIDVLRERTKQILTDLGIRYRSQGLCFDMITDTRHSYLKFKEAGFSFNAYNPDSIPLMVPLIADEEYFEFLKTGLGKIYNV